MSLSPSQIPLPNDIRADATAIFDVNGNQLSGFDSSRPSTAAITSVPSSITSVTLLAANLARRRVIIVNESSKTLFVAFGATASATAYAVSIAGNQTYQGPLNDYTGQITGIWSAVNGNA